ncbi:MAG: hypothetical protein QOH66_1229 [Actinomycetota bacterium]|jgi:hypothetical protein|nr:hypothetical protein [Actinomycetota bacterium]
MKARPVMRSAEKGFLRFVLGLGAVCLALGCAGQKTGTPRALSSAASPSGGQPLVRIGHPPVEPPSLALMAPHPSGWARLQEGAILNGTWLDAAKSARHLGPGDGSVPWPEGVAVTKESGVGIELPGPAIPRTLTVRAFGPRLDQAGAPADPPLFQLECDSSRFMSRQQSCILLEFGKFYILELAGLPKDQVSYMSVNVTWPIPQGTHRTEISIDQGTWLFRTSSAQ